jgi:hypothetical protein
VPRLPWASATQIPIGAFLATVNLTARPPNSPEGRPPARAGPTDALLKLERDLALGDLAPRAAASSRDRRMILHDCYAAHRASGRSPDQDSRKWAGFRPLRDTVKQLLTTFAGSP